MPTSSDKKSQFRTNYAHLANELVIKTNHVDKFKITLYKMFCPICRQDRGFLRYQAAFLPCKKCGQKHKLGKKGPKHTESSKKKLSDASLRNSPIGRILSKEERKIIHTLRSRINHFVKSRTKTTTQLLGCSHEELKFHLESKFQLGMTWENYGRTGWHIDHIRPLSSFILSNPEELEKACHYTNLQPLWAKDNILKSNKVVL